MSPACLVKSCDAAHHHGISNVVQLHWFLILLESSCSPVESTGFLIFNSVALFTSAFYAVNINELFCVIHGHIMIPEVVL